MPVGAAGQTVTVTPIACHFAAAADADAAAGNLDRRVVVVGPELTGHDPARPWTLVVCVPLRASDHGVDHRTLDTLARTAAAHGGEVDRRRMDEPGSVNGVLRARLPQPVLDRFRRENAHVETSDGATASAQAEQGRLL